MLCQAPLIKRARGCPQAARPTAGEQRAQVAAFINGALHIPDHLQLIPRGLGHCTRVETARHRLDGWIAPRQRQGESAACVWQSPSGWTGCRFRLGFNREAFDAEVLAIYQALRIVDQRQESGHRCIAFVDSASAIDQVRNDALGPGQRFAIAEMEVCD